jgi:hypothetical protein
LIYLPVLELALGGALASRATVAITKPAAITR